MSISFKIWTIWSFGEMVFNAIEIWFVYRFFMQTLIKAKDYVRKPIIGAICLFLYITVLNNVQGLDGKFMTLLSYLGTFSYAIVAFNADMAKKIFVSTLPITVVVWSDFLTFSVSIILDIFSPTRAWNSTYDRFIMNLIYLSFMMVLYLVVSRFYQSYQRIMNQSVVLTIFIAMLGVLSILVVNFLIMIGAELISFNADTRRLKIYVIFIGVAFLAIYSSCIFFFKRINDLLIKNKEAEMQNQYRSLKEEYYDNIQNSLRNLECFRHDVMKHFQILSILVAHDKKEEAQAYLSDLHSHYSQHLEIANYTNDDVLNAILSNKKSEAKNNNIMIRITAEKIVKFPISSYELCSLFDNLLDNAIEACQKVETGRFIDVFISLIDQQMRIIIKNSYNGELLIEDKTFLTTKKDKLNHGMGVQIIKKIVSNAGGECKMEKDESESIFIVTILIPISG